MRPNIGSLPGDEDDDDENECENRLGFIRGNPVEDLRRYAYGFLAIFLYSFACGRWVSGVMYV